MTWLVSDSELGGLHKHCYKCFSVKKCSREGDACPVMECTNQCGAQFHACKEADHGEICGMERVPCLNINYGCDQEMPRNKIVEHLPSCPASIVACTQEWNRWPVFCRERYKAVPFRQKNPRASRGQLDLELTLRDQRMVRDLAHVPRRTKLALRNNLTRRYPALPLPAKIVRKPTFQDRTLKTLRDVVKLEVADHEAVGPQYGVAKLFLRNQEIQQRRWQEDVDNAILRTGQPVPKRYWEYEELEKGNIHKHCAYCINTNCDKTPDYELGEVNIQCCRLFSCPWDCGARLHHCKAFEHKMICKNFEEEGEFDWILRDRMTRKKPAVKEKPPKPFEDLLATPFQAGSSSSHDSSRGPASKTTRRRGIPAPPPPPQNLHQVVGFDVRMETVTRVQQKPKAMYTFLCGQELRRDQWEQHCKNVHSDIHGGLNNWLEARCPLAAYGCGFAFRRLYPGRDPRGSVVFSEATESFGIRPPPLPLKEGKRTARSLVDLPLELLQQIFLWLDSWSLSQMSLVSRTMREVSATLLDLRGCVALQWERVGDGVIVKKRGWKVAYKRWFFSSHFSQVDSWGLNADGAISEHLKTCPYNIRTVHQAQDRTSRTAKDLMKALNSKIQLKRQSVWFIE